MDDHTNTPDREQRPEEYRASHGGSLRSDGVSGVILICLGTFSAVTNAMQFVVGIAMYVFVQVLFSNVRPPPFGPSMTVALRFTILQVPVYFVLGISLLICGIKIRRGSQAARRVAQWTVLVGAAWFLACLVYAALYLFPHFSASPAGAPWMEAAMRIFAVWGNLGIVTVVVAFLLYILSRPKQRETSSSAETD